LVRIKQLSQRRKGRKDKEKASVQMWTEAFLLYPGGYLIGQDWLAHQAGRVNV